MENAITIASATAALAVSRVGAQSSYPTMEEVCKFLKSHSIGKPLDLSSSK